jgi:hypothetical protein
VAVPVVRTSEYLYPHVRTYSVSLLEFGILGLLCALLAAASIPLLLRKIYPWLRVTAISSALVVLQQLVFLLVGEVEAPFGYLANIFPPEGQIVALGWVPLILGVSLLLSAALGLTEPRPERPK